MDKTTPRHATKAQLAYRAALHLAAKQAAEMLPIGEASEVVFSEFLGALVAVVL